MTPAFVHPPPRPADLTAQLALACDGLPGLLRGALVLVSEQVLLAGTGGESVLDYEPLLRSTIRCLTVGPTATAADRPAAPFVELAFVADDQVVVIQRGRRDPRVALALACSREANLAFVLACTRVALARVEETIDLSAWVD